MSTPQYIAQDTTSQGAVMSLAHTNTGSNITNVVLANWGDEGTLNQVPTCADSNGTPGTYLGKINGVYNSAT